MSLYKNFIDFFSLYDNYHKQCYVHCNVLILNFNLLGIFCRYKYIFICSFFYTRTVLKKTKNSYIMIHYNKVKNIYADIDAGMQNLHTADLTEYNI